MKLLTIIGETSGDLHGGNVLIEIKKINPAIKIIGTGGNLFKTVANQTYHSIEEMEVIGLIEVLKHWKKLKRIFQRMVHLLDSESPDAVFLVDYVGFNLRFAAQAKKRNIPVYFYISIKTLPPCKSPEVSPIIVSSFISHKILKYNLLLFVFFSLLKKGR